MTRHVTIARGFGTRLPVILSVVLVQRNHSRILRRRHACIFKRASVALIFIARIRELLLYASPFHTANAFAHVRQVADSESVNTVGAWRDIIGASVYAESGSVFSLVATFFLSLFATLFLSFFFFFRTNNDERLRHIVARDRKFLISPTRTHCPEIKMRPLR